MKSKLIIILVVGCLLTGCGQNKENTKDMPVQTDIAEKVTQTPTPTEEANNVIDGYDVTEEETETSEEDKDMAIDCSKSNICDIKAVGYKKENNYRKAILFEKLETNQVQKTFEAEIEVTDTDMKDIYNQYDVIDGMPDEEYFHNNYFDNYMRYGDSSNPLVQFSIKNNYDLSNLFSTKTIFLKKDIETGEVRKCVVVADRHWDKETTEDGDFQGTNRTIYEDMIAVVDEEEERKICLLNMEENTYEIIDFKNMVVNEFGICKANLEYRDDKKYDEVKVHDLTFINENKLAVKTSFDHVFIYDIANSEITDSVNLRGYKWKEFDLKNGMCNLSRVTKDGTMEFFVINLDNMQIISHIESSDNDFKSCRFEYREGITYCTNDKGLYAYNPKTEKYDVIYADFEKETEYTDEKIEKKNKKLGEYEQMHTEVIAMFADDTVYLLRAVYGFVEDGEMEVCLERKYKKITLK